MKILYESFELSRRLRDARKMPVKKGMIETDLITNHLIDMIDCDVDVYVSVCQFKCDLAEDVKSVFDLVRLIAEGTFSFSDGFARFGQIVYKIEKQESKTSIRLKYFTDKIDSSD